MDQLGHICCGPCLASVKRAYHTGEKHITVEIAEEQINEFLGEMCNFYFLRSDTGLRPGGSVNDKPGTHRVTVSD